MRIVITGGFGFLGTMLARELLGRGEFRGEPVTRLVLADRYVRRDDPIVADPRVEVAEGDVTELTPVLFADQVDVVFHLAAAVSSECERDFDLGMAANLDTTRVLLEAARRQSADDGPQVTLLLSSSVAVFGADAALPLPEVVSEATLPTPQSSYGIQKFAAEQLIADYTRKGFLDGRVARLMTVAIRPGKPNAAASGFVSGIVREPLAGIAAVCPVDPSLALAIASPRTTIRGILAVAETPRGDGPEELTGRIPVNLPALTVTVADLLDTLRRVAGDDVADLVTVAPDPAIEGIVGSWPARFDWSRAASLGLTADSDAESVIRQFMVDNPEAVRVG